MSAHHYFRDFAYCDSGMIPLLLMIELRSRTGKLLSDSDEWLASNRLDLQSISTHIDCGVFCNPSLNRFLFTRLCNVILVRNRSASFETGRHFQTVQLNTNFFFFKSVGIKVWIPLCLRPEGPVGAAGALRLEGERVTLSDVSLTTEAFP